MTWSIPDQDMSHLPSSRSFYPSINESELLPQNYKDWNTPRPVPKMFVVNDDGLRYYGMRGSIYTPRLEWNHGDEVDATLEPQR